MEVKDIINKGKLIYSQWDTRIGYNYERTREVEYLGLSETYLYKGVKYFVDYEYQDTTKENYDYKKIERVEENEWN